jgi:hypothetical protein
VPQKIQLGDTRRRFTKPARSRRPRKRQGGFKRAHIARQIGKIHAVADTAPSMMFVATRAGAAIGSTVTARAE